MEPRDAMDVDQIKQLLRALADAEVEYVLVGGVAMTMHGLVRATEDVDPFVDPSPVNVQRLRQALRRMWDDPAIDAITAEDLAGDFPAIRYGPPDTELVIDVLARRGEAFQFEDLAWEFLDFEEVSVRVATPRTLYLMKRGTVREIDKLDAARLRDRFPEADPDAREAVERGP